MINVYKYGFWILLIYVCLDIFLYLTNYECMNMCIPDYLNFSRFIIGSIKWKNGSRKDPNDHILRCFALYNKYNLLVY